MPHATTKTAAILTRIPDKLPKALRVALYPFRRPRISDEQVRECFFRWTITRRLHTNFISENLGSFYIFNPARGSERITIGQLAHELRHTVLNIRANLFSKPGPNLDYYIKFYNDSLHDIAGVATLYSRALRVDCERLVWALGCIQGQGQGQGPSDPSLPLRTAIRWYHRKYHLPPIPHPRDGVKYANAIRARMALVNDRIASLRRSLDRINYISCASIACHRAIRDHYTYRHGPANIRHLSGSLATTQTDLCREVCDFEHKVRSLTALLRYIWEGLHVELDDVAGSPHTSMATPSGSPDVSS